MLDIDFFKQYNDNYGHPMGDKVLKKVAAALTNRLKRPSDTLARYGGEEFVIILKDMDKDQAIHFANSLVKTIQELKVSHNFSDVQKVITISIGVSYKNPLSDITQEHILQQADNALYEAKNRGRNQAVLFEDN
jgi:diguanylate cyclase (GGDEF)-like protein